MGGGPGTGLRHDPYDEIMRQAQEAVHKEASRAWQLSQQLAVAEGKLREAEQGRSGFSFGPFGL